VENCGLFDQFLHRDTMAIRDAPDAGYAPRVESTE
jgi:hypothetical protein